ncbi:MAG: NADH:flavin oxidoreductase [Proteobacteria bacterium]|nr:NADH:flavin oxidoreductase [Pseudomonadota bacterium]
MSERFPRVASLKSPARLRARLDELGCALPCDDEVQSAPESPLAASLCLPDSGGGPRKLANRFAIQPMEGWDAEPDGRPSELTRRRWRRFGVSGAAWIWGGEAVAVRPDGRANPNQLLMSEKNAPSIGALRRELVQEADGAVPLVGLQLTYSGRWSRPTSAGPAPRIAFRHPVLDGRLGIDCDDAVFSDGELRDLVGHFAAASALAQAEGFDFVDVKHCHGYLLHELLAARSRGGAFGGPSLEDRTRLLFAILEAVRRAAPGLAIGVRLSVFDAVPHRPSEGRPSQGPSGPDAGGRLGPGVPEPHPLPYLHGFGLDPEAPERPLLDEPIALVRALVGAGVRWINVTAGSPYTVPHIQRPAAFPPSDGYAPPEDPLRGVARLLGAARALKKAVPECAVLSSGWSYLQDFLPHVAQACVRDGWFDAVGLGRLALSYPELPAHVLAGKTLERGRLCRTFSDCTSAPRNGLVSGCYPLDDFYRSRPERQTLEAAKRAAIGGAVSAR